MIHRGWNISPKRVILMQFWWANTKQLCLKRSKRTMNSHPATMPMLKPATDWRNVSSLGAFGRSKERARVGKDLEKVRKDQRRVWNKESYQAPADYAASVATGRLNARRGSATIQAVLAARVVFQQLRHPSLTLVKIRVCPLSSCSYLVSMSPPSMSLLRSCRQSCCLGM